MNSASGTMRPGTRTGARGFWCFRATRAFSSAIAAGVLDSLRRLAWTPLCALCALFSRTDGKLFALAGFPDVTALGAVLEREEGLALDTPAELDPCTARLSSVLLLFAISLPLPLLLPLLSDLFAAGSGEDSGTSLGLGAGVHIGKFDNEGNSDDAELAVESDVCSRVAGLGVRVCSIDFLSLMHSAAGVEPSIGDAWDRLRHASSWMDVSLDI